jgi:hypothetical protein
MKQIVLDEIDRILAMPLFSKCGSWTPVDTATIPCKDIHSAISLMDDHTWFGVIKLSADNHITEKLFGYCRDIYNSTWRPVNDYIYPITGAHIFKCLDCFVLTEEYRSTAKISANTDIIGYLLELQYSEYVPPGFFTSVFKYYEQGYMPCGWDGEYPNGKLIVF